MNSSIIIIEASVFITLMLKLVKVKLICFICCWLGIFMYNFRLLFFLRIFICELTRVIKLLELKILYLPPKSSGVEMLSSIKWKLKNLRLLLQNDTTAHLFSI